MICSQGALAKGTSSFPPYKKERPRKNDRRGEKEGEFFFERTRERDGKLKEGESFLNKREGNGKEAKEERGQATLKQQGGEMGRTRGGVLNEREGSFETERGGKF